MPLSALLKIPKLCAVSLYFFEDSAYTSCSTDSTGKLSNKDLKTKTTHKVLINPVCYRTLQRMACQDDWKLDEAAQFSIDNWTLKIGSENVLHFARGMRVPRPQNPNFYSPTGVYQVAVGFWTPFQQRMWDYFLTHDTGPCYLDAAYRCDHDGFQVWTLFFERQGQTVPISYLVTTGTSLRLVADWLEALVSRSSQMPRKTIFVNTLKAVISVEAVFGNWDVRFAKYYIDQAVRAVVLRRRGECPFGSAVMQAVQNIGEQFSEAIAAIKDQPDLRPEFEYLLCQEDQWMPKTYGQTAEFNYSSSAVSQWRYLLWSTMLSRPDTNRVDSVLYFLASVLTPGVEEAVNALGDKTSSEVFDMSSVEQGGHSPVPSLSKTNRMPLGSSVICLFDSSASTKNIVDHHYGVCYCSKFAQQGMCEHLIYCSTNIIHQPWLVKIMDDMPLA
ncbi:hypothetical protein H4S02_000542 [Coemansia sp. RSA 2611]|nr:hypothetical protein H4S02_000542 [Coemansia sp. RSA 2611]